MNWDVVYIRTGVAFASSSNYMITIIHKFVHHSERKVFLRSMGNYGMFTTNSFICAHDVSKMSQVIMSKDLTIS